MLSYQHGYHAGNLADVHKHALLAWTLAYMVQKDKPLSYLETHAGRGLYDLSASQANKTQEARSGIHRVYAQFPADHPYRIAIDACRAEHGHQHYPGSPKIAEHFKRPGDRLQLAELHPQEHEALAAVMGRSGVHIYKEDGFPWAARLSPPTPRRGLILIDPSYELAHDFSGIPSFLEGLHQLWPVGVVMLWYPVLKSGDQKPMVNAIQSAGLTDLFHQEVRFAPRYRSRGLTGSGMFVINAPYTMADQATEIAQRVESP